ncbi:MAG: hypothetical protein K6L73_07790 [Cellvibrionaceae bacterium]
MPHTLDSEKVLYTISRLEDRIGERFPDASLLNVCSEFYGIAKDSRRRIEWIDKPNYLLRWGIGSLIAISLVVLCYTVSLLDLRVKLPDLPELIQLMEALFNDIILISAAIFFLVSIEMRVKRARALESLHELRGLAHVVDMHQLTKDPDMILATYQLTNSSPKNELNAFQLRRYLDYCSELLALIGKVAAMYSEKLPDPEIVNAASDVEELCTNLSRKIWQKIVTIENH